MGEIGIWGWGLRWRKGAVDARGVIRANAGPHVEVEAPVRVVAESAMD